jgi:hypothetical protein
VRKRTSDAPPAHRVLQAARKAAGFETAAAAAAHFGWSVGRYRSHESGARNIPGEDVRRYAKSFKTPPATLHAPDWDTVDRLLDEARKASEVPRIEIAKRLRCARILRGLPSAAAASKILGIGTPTYLKHENGSNGINDDMAQFYAQEFRISPDWLLSGERPSGLGASVDSRIHSILRNPKNFAGVAEAPLLHSFQEEPPAILKTGRPTGVTPIPEYRWSDLASNAGDVSLAKPYGVVQFPNSADFWNDSLFSIVVDTEYPPVQRYSRIFVSRRVESLSFRAEYLISSASDLGIVALEYDQLRNVTGLVGRVVGKLEAPPQG